MRWFSLVLVFLLTFPSPPPIAAQAAGGLNIVIIEGEGAINNVRQRTARDPIVQVEDQNHKPIAGAVVVFTLPSDGASGTFTGGVKTLTVTTDNSGRAVGSGLRPNNLNGELQIHVNASFQGQTASATISQMNAIATATATGSTAAGGISGKLIAIIAVVGAAAAGGVIAATRGGNSSGAPAPPAPVPPTTVTPGTGTVGAPR